MRFAIRSSGHDSELGTAIHIFHDRNGRRTSIRSSGFPNWPTHLKGTLTISTTTIGDSEYASAATRTYTPDSEVMLNDSDYGYSLTYSPYIYNNNDTALRFGSNRGVTVRSGGIIRDQYTPPYMFPIQSNNNNVPYDADAVKNEDNFSRDITVRRQIPTNVSGGGGGGGGGSSTPDQIWY